VELSVAGKREGAEKLTMNNHREALQIKRAEFDGRLTAEAEK
jgi:hypothetical protein